MADQITLGRPAELEVAKSGLTAGRVLLAEDDTEMRRLLASALRNHRYEVIEATDGKELIDQISESLLSGRPVDFIVTDVRMPKLTGIQVMKFIKNAGLDVPVIIITAFGDHATRIDAFLNGAAAVLDKPFDIDDLMDEVRRLGAGPE